ncbi:class I SAM-dependent methyltransferase [Granulicoccus sp. GXG6511]|uniref:class I SAM-dependent methyltransferase n=1 Tax=Granulicoccus sp. GXG6511 TaxID=3381351 RepID=UPI003D7E1729
MSARERVEQFWVDRGLPRAVDIVLSDRIVGGWRAAAIGAARGTVLELGFGSGRNLRFYGDDVSEVLAIDPSDVAWRLAQSDIARFGRPVTRVGDDAALIDLPDNSVDTVVATWTLCSIPDIESALTEARRVLRPDGRFRLVEHSLSPKQSVRRFQRAAQPVWGRVSGGCHIDRDMVALLAGAGFDTSTLDARDAFRVPPVQPWSWFVSGAAGLR